MTPADTARQLVQARLNGHDDSLDKAMLQDVVSQSSET